VSFSFRQIYFSEPAENVSVAQNESIAGKGLWGDPFFLKKRKSTTGMQSNNNGEKTANHKWFVKVSL
jgi:hypothetical protein